MHINKRDSPYDGTWYPLRRVWAVRAFNYFVMGTGVLVMITPITALIVLLIRYGVDWDLQPSLQIWPLVMNPLISIPITCVGLFLFLVGAENEKLS